MRQIGHLRYALVMLLSGTALVAGGCATSASARGGGSGEVGVASYYAHKYHGRTTASGERFDMNALTAAHRTLPFGTRVRVQNLDNGKSVTVRITDRGPFVNGRVIDLSLAAAKKIDMVGPGLAKVRIQPDRGESIATAR